MGLGISIEVTTLAEPTETVEVTCSKCGSKLKITRIKSWAEGMPIGPPGMGGEYPSNTEQKCPVCGASACEEPQNIEVKTKKKIDFFSLFGG